MNSKKIKKAILKLKKAALNPGGSQIQKNAKKMSTKMTWPEREFKKLLQELQVEFEVQKIIQNKIYDFYIPSLNLLVEIDGDYYHANPETQDMENLNGLQKKIVRNDGYKNSLAEGLGYKLVRVWENDLKTRYTTVKNKFKKLLKA